MTLLPAERPIRAIGLLPFATARLREELARLAGLEVAWVTSAAALAEIIADYDVAILPEALYDAAIARALAAPGRRTHWLALATAGYGTVLHHGIPSDIVITNASPVWAPIVAEHAVAMLLALLRQMPRCDAVMLAIALADSTRHLFDAALLARLPQGARIVNVARGGLVDTAALLAALDSGHLAGAASDVFEEEPLPASHPIWHNERVIVSPHVAGFGSRAALDRLADLYLDNFTRALAGLPLQHVVRLAPQAPGPR